MPAKTFPAFCLLLAFAACLGSAARVAAAPFVSRHGYTLTVPPNWNVVRGPAGGDNDVIMSVKPGTDRTLGAGTPNLNVKYVPLPAKVTLEQFQQSLGPVYKQQFPGMTMLSQKYSTFSGVRGLDMVFLKPQAGQQVRVRQVYALKNSAVYIFTAAYPNAVHAKYDPIVAQMLGSLRWKP